MLSGRARGAGTKQKALRSRRATQGFQVLGAEEGTFHRAAPLAQRLRSAQNIFRSGVSILTQRADRDCGDVTLVDRGCRSGEIRPPHDIASTGCRYIGWLATQLSHEQFQVFA